MTTDKTKVPFSIKGSLEGIEATLLDMEDLPDEVKDKVQVVIETIEELRDSFHRDMLDTQQLLRSLGAHF